MKKKMWASAAGVLVGLGGLGFAALWVGQERLLYAPETSHPGSAAAVDPGASDVALRTRDGFDLEAWRFNPSQGNEKAALYLPGNGGNRGGRVPVAHAFAERGFTTLLMDYRGFGGNPGSPNEGGLTEDARAGYAYLLQEGFAAENIYIVGESLGTAVGIRLAAQEKAGGVLLRSPFTSMPDVAQRITKIPVGWALKDHYDSRSQIVDLHVPVTILAGGDDDLVPAAQSREVAGRAPNLVQYVELPDVGHNDAIWFGPLLADHLTQLANR